MIHTVMFKAVDDECIHVNLNAAMSADLISLFVAPAAVCMLFYAV